MELILGIIVGILLSCIFFCVALIFGINAKKSQAVQDIIDGKVNVKEIFKKPKGKIFKGRSELEEVISNNIKGIKIK